MVRVPLKFQISKSFWYLYGGACESSLMDEQLESPQEWTQYESWAQSDRTKTSGIGLPSVLIYPSTLLDICGYSWITLQSPGHLATERPFQIQV